MMIVLHYGVLTMKMSGALTMKMSGVLTMTVLRPNDDGVLLTMMIVMSWLYIDDSVVMS